MTHSCFGGHAGFEGISRPGSTRHSIAGQRSDLGCGARWDPNPKAEGGVYIILYHHGRYKSHLRYPYLICTNYQFVASAGNAESRTRPRSATRSLGRLSTTRALTRSSCRYTRSRSRPKLSQRKKKHAKTRYHKKVPQFSGQKSQPPTTPERPNMQPTLFGLATPERAVPHFWEITPLLVALDT